MKSKILKPIKKTTNNNKKISIDDLTKYLENSKI